MEKWGYLNIVFGGGGIVSIHSTEELDLNWLSRAVASVKFGGDQPYGSQESKRASSLEEKKVKLQIDERLIISASLPKFWQYRLLVRYDTIAEDFYWIVAAHLCANGWEPLGRGQFKKRIPSSSP